MAKVDIKHFFDEVVQVVAPEVKLDKHFSNVKDKHFKVWKRTELERTLKAIWGAYKASCSGMTDYVEIQEPKVW